MNPVAGSTISGIIDLLAIINDLTIKLSVERSKVEDRVALYMRLSFVRIKLLERKRDLYLLSFDSSIISSYWYTQDCIKLITYAQCSQVFACAKTSSQVLVHSNISVGQSCACRPKNWEDQDESSRIGGVKIVRSHRYSVPLTDRVYSKPKKKKKNLPNLIKRFKGKW